MFWTAVVSDRESALESALEMAICVGWAEVHLFLSVSSVSADSIQCDCGKEGIQLCGVDEA